jgi:hypothetical protein
MVSSTTGRPVRQERKPLLPVQVRAYFVGGAARQDLLDGAAVLSITDLSTGEEQAYWAEAVYDGSRLACFRLRKFGGSEQYDLPPNLAACDCPDAVFRSGRPGGCRHQQALRQALPAVNKATA